MRLCSTYLLSCFVLLATTVRTLAQVPANEIGQYIERLDAGQVDDVRQALPDLSTRYPNNPGLLYLQGRLASDGIEAVKIYQSVVDNYPQSEWADDALYRVYQYYYSMGLYRTANLKLQQLRTGYPSSPYVTGKRPPAAPQKDEVVKVPAKEPVELDSIPTVQQVVPSAPPKQTFAVQTGAYSTSANAEKQRLFFRQLGYAAEVTNKVRNGRSLFLVWVGSFPSAEAARKFGKEVKTKFRIDSIIVEKY